MAEVSHSTFDQVVFSVRNIYKPISQTALAPEWLFSAVVLEIKPCRLATEKTGGLPLVSAVALSCSKMHCGAFGQLNQKFAVITKSTRTGGRTLKYIIVRHLNRITLRFTITRSPIIELIHSRPTAIGRRNDKGYRKVMGQLTTHRQLRGSGVSRPNTEKLFLAAHQKCYELVVSVTLSLDLAYLLSSKSEKIRSIKDV